MSRNLFPNPAMRNTGNLFADVPPTLSTVGGRSWASTTGTYLYAQGSGTAGRLYAARITVGGTPGASYSLGSSDLTVGPFTESKSGTIPASGEVEVVLRASVAASGTDRLVGLTAGAAGLRITGALLEEVDSTTADPSPYFDGNSPGAYWDGTPDASTSRLPELTATYDPDYVRVGVEGKDFDDALPLTLTRDGEPVRGGEGIVPSAGAFFLWDYEAPYSVPLSYVADFGASTASAASVTVPVTGAWLRAPGLPSLDLPILPREVPALTQPRPSTTLRPLGRRKPVVLSTARAAGEFVLNVWTQSDTEAAALQALVDEAAVVLLLMPGARGVEHVYVALGDVDQAPLTGHLTGAGESWTLWSLPATIVDSPIGGVYGDPTASYQVVLDTLATYSALDAAHDTYLSVLRGA